MEDAISNIKESLTALIMMVFLIIYCSSNLIFSILLLIVLGIKKLWFEIIIKIKGNKWK